MTSRVTWSGGSLGQLEAVLDEATGTRTYFRYVTATGRLSAGMRLGLFAFAFVGFPALFGAGALTETVAGRELGPALARLVFFAGFAALGTYLVLGAAPAWRLTTGPSWLLQIGPHGLAIRDEASLRWGDIASIRRTHQWSVFRWAPRDYDPVIEIRPRDPAALEGLPWTDRAFEAYRGLLGRVLPVPGLASPAIRFHLNLLEAPWRAVIEDIERYHPVEGR